MSKIIIVILGLFIGHIVYGHFISDHGLVWDVVFEKTWHQFGALLVYWLLWRDEK